MEISNKIPNQNFSISKCAQKQLKPSCKASFRGNCASATCDFGTLGKTKVVLDDKKILTLDEKLELLKSAGVDECDIENYLKFTDKNFKNVLLYIKKGVSPQDAYNFVKNFANRSGEPIVLELIENGVPYSFAEHIGLSRSLYGEKYFDNDKIEIIKNGDFNSSKYKDDFKIEDYDLTRIFGNASSDGDQDKYKMFCKLQKDGIDGNIAAYLACNKYNSFDKVKEILSNKDIGLSNDIKCAYYLYDISQAEMQKIIEICKKFNLDPNNYNDWKTILRTRNLDEAETLLESGTPLEFLKVRGNFDEAKLEKAIKYFKDGNISANIALNLTDYDDKVAYEIIKRINSGLSANNAVVLAHMELDENKKKEIADLVLDGTFSHVTDAKEYLQLDLDNTTKEKVLELIKHGACTPLALTCAKDETCYKTAFDLIESGTCEDLKDVYAYSTDDFLSSANLLRLGIPKEHLSMYSCILTNEQKELMELGVPFETIKEIENGELELNTTSEVKELLKKGVDYKTACKLHENLTNNPENYDAIFEMAGANLDANKILTLAQIQQSEGQPFKKEDLELVKAFASRVDNLSEFKKLYELGMLNENALKNYDEIIKRGVSNKKSLESLTVAQINFKDTKELDRACELLKNDVSSCFIPFSIKDDNAAINAANNEKYLSSKFSEYEIVDAYIAKYIKEGMPLEDVKLIRNERLKQEEVELLDNFLKKGHTVKNAIAIVKKSLWYSGMNRIEDFNTQLPIKEKISDYVLKGCTINGVAEILLNKDLLQKFENLINKGVEPCIAEKITALKIKEDDKKAIEKIKSLCNSNLKDELLKMNSNPLLEPAIQKLYDFKNYENYEFQKLLRADITIKDIKKSALTFIKSPLKQAMKHPNLYLSNLPSIDTEKIGGKYPELTDEKLEKYQSMMVDFFKDNMPEITRTLKYLDIDTFNQMMDKRTTFFGEQLRMLNKMDNKHFEITSAITKCQKNDGKLLSAKEKIDLSKIILYHQLGYLDTDYLENSIKEGKVNVEDLNKKIFEKLIEVVGIDPDEIKNIPEEKLDFDKEYIYLLLRTQESTDFLMFKEMMNGRNLEEARKEIEEMLELSDEEIIHNGSTRESCEELLKLIDKMDAMDEKEIYKEFSRISPFSHVDCTIQEVAKMALLEDFKTYITQGDNKFAKTNKETENKFKELGLNYEKWLNYDEKADVELEGNEYQIKLWDRKPQKDLFMGNRTSCCTAVIDGGNGKATPIYLTNTAFNVVQLKDKNGNIVGMSRIFVGNIDEKPATIIENIELNSAFSKTLDDEGIKNLRDSMFNYIKNFTKEISGGQDMKVYFSKSYTHVPTDDLNSAQENVDFVGNLTSDSIYLNCAPGWVQPETLKNKACDLYEI